MDWIVSPENSHVEALNPKGMLFGDMAFGRLLSSDEAMRVKSSWWDLCP